MPIPALCSSLASSFRLEILAVTRVFVLARLSCELASALIPIFAFGRLINVSRALASRLALAFAFLLPLPLPLPFGVYSAGFASPLPLLLPLRLYLRPGGYFLSRNPAICPRSQFSRVNDRDEEDQCNTLDCPLGACACHKHPCCLVKHTQSCGGAISFTNTQHVLHHQSRLSPSLLLTHSKQAFSVGSNSIGMFPHRPPAYTSAQFPVMVLHCGP